MQREKEDHDGLLLSLCNGQETHILLYRRPKGCLFARTESHLSVVRTFV